MFKIFFQQISFSQKQTYFIGSAGSIAEKIDAIALP